MTCIVGLEHEGEVWIGGDSIAVEMGSLRKSIRQDEKVFNNKHIPSMVIGFSGSFRIGQLLRYSFVPPLKPTRLSVHEYLATSFIDAVRQCFKANGTMQYRDGLECAHQFLIGYGGNLFLVDSDFQVAKLSTNYAAIGTGGDAAMGSLYTSCKQNIADPKHAITVALEASAAFNAGVSPPWTILKTARMK